MYKVDNGWEPTVYHKELYLMGCAPGGFGQRAGAGQVGRSRFAAPRPAGGSEAPGQDHLNQKVYICKVSIKTSTLFLSPDCSPIWQGQPFQWTNSSVASSVAVLSSSTRGDIWHSLKLGHEPWLSLRHLSDSISWHSTNTFALHDLRAFVINQKCILNLENKLQPGTHTKKNMLSISLIDSRGILNLEIANRIKWSICSHLFMEEQTLSLKQKTLIM